MVRKELDMTEQLTFRLIFLLMCIYTHTYKLYIYTHIHTNTYTKLYITQSEEGLLDYFKFLTGYLTCFCISLPLILNSIAMETILPLFLLTLPMPLLDTKKTGKVQPKHEQD